MLSRYLLAPLAALLLLAAAPPRALAQNATFALQANPPATGGSGAGDVVAADVNGDGYPDALVLNTGSNTVSVLLGDGTGHFALQANPSGTGGTGSRHMAVADMNGDGKLDALVTNYDSNNVGVLLGDGKGGFAVLASPPATGINLIGNPIALAVADTNHDGYLDVVVTNYSTNSYPLTVLLGDGTGRFPRRGQGTAGVHYPIALVLAEVSRKGILDAVVYFEDLGLSVLSGTNNGNFYAKMSNFIGGYQGMTSMVTADFDGNGSPDMLTTAPYYTSYYNCLVLYLGAGQTRSAPVRFLTGGDIPTSVALADANGDGKLDVLVANNGSDNLGVLLGDGKGGLALQARPPATGGSGPSGVAVADVNGDGRPDALVANANSNTLGVLLNTTGLPSVWTGALSTDWFTTGNWTNDVPSTDTDVTLPAAPANQPVIGGDTATTRRLTLASGATLTNAGTLQLTGDLTNAGTLASSGTLLFSGSTDQTFTPGAATVTRLTLANTGAAGANRLLLTQDLTVDSLLTLTQGLVRTQAPGSPLATLSLLAGGSVQGEGPGQYVQGRLQVARAAVNASTGSLDFTNGLVLNPNGQDLGAVTVTRTAGLQTAGVSYGQNVGATSQGIDRVWQVVASNPFSPSVPASVTVSWVSDDDNGFDPNTPAQLWRADQASGPWVAQGAAGSVSARSFTANTTQLGTLTVSNTSAPLPVELVAFTAQAQGPDALLRWTTASELHNDRFEVEASADGQAFHRIGTLAGQGSSLLGHSYQLVDPAIAHYAASPVYYRLRQVDTDGTASYAPVRAVAVARPAGLALFPNPTSQVATLSGAAAGAPVTVLDVVGRPVLRVSADSTGTAALVLPAGLGAGVYVVRVGSKALRLTVE